MVPVTTPNSSASSGRGSGNAGGAGDQDLLGEGERGRADGGFAGGRARGRCRGRLRAGLVGGGQRGAGSSPSHASTPPVAVRPALCDPITRKSESAFLWLGRCPDGSRALAPSGGRVGLLVADGDGLRITGGRSWHGLRAGSDVLPEVGDGDGRAAERHRVLVARAARDLARPGPRRVLPVCPPETSPPTEVAFSTRESRKVLSSTMQRRSELRQPSTTADGFTIVESAALPFVTCGNAAAGVSDHTSSHACRTLTESVASSSELAAPLGVWSASQLARCVSIHVARCA